jgi:predicted nucleic acid-binding protein
MQIFVDTNILYYADNTNSTFAEQAKQRMNDLLLDGHTLIISGQILREYANASIRDARRAGIDMPIAVQLIQRNINVYKNVMTVLYDDANVFNLWNNLLPTLRTQKDIFDLNIIATMKSNEITHILTHNISDFTQFSDITILSLQI